MTPFRKAVLDDGTKKTRYDLYQIFKRRFELAKKDLATGDSYIKTPSLKDLEKMYKDNILGAECYINDKYQVNVYRNEKADFMVLHENLKGKMTYLSIKRLDKQSIHDWRELMDIKNTLTSPEQEAVELYPAEWRRVDTANQYHLFVFPKGFAPAFGYMERLVDTTERKGGINKAGQRGS
jgi:hypothetical protein